MDVGCTPQQNPQERPGVARRLPFFRIISPRPRRDRGYLPDLRQVRRLAVRLAGPRLEASHGAWQQATFTTSFHLGGPIMKRSKSACALVAAATFFGVSGVALAAPTQADFDACNREAQAAAQSPATSRRSSTTRPGSTTSGGRAT